MSKMAYTGVISAFAQPSYLVMGIRVPSVCQVLVNQGLLVLRSCLQEHFQVHRLQWDLGLLLLGEQNRTELSPRVRGHPSLPLHQSGPAHLACSIIVVLRSHSQEIKNGKCVLCTN